MTKNNKFQNKLLICLSISLAIILFVSALCSTNLNPASAENDLSFGLYVGTDRADGRADEYFVIGNGDDLSLVFDSVVSDVNSVSIKIGENTYSLSSDGKTVYLPSLTGVNTVIVETASGIKSVIVSVGWTEVEGLTGVYYLPNEGGWRPSGFGFSSQETDRLRESEMRLITKGVEYLSFDAVAVNATSGRKDVCGTVSTDKNVFGVSRSSISGGFVLNAEFDVVVFSYAPKSSGNEESAELDISNLSTETQYVSITCDYDETIGEIYYYDSYNAKTIINTGVSSIPKYLKTDIYFGSFDSSKSVKLFDYSFTGGSSSSDEFEEGVDEFSAKLYFEINSTIKATFKQGFEIPIDYAPVIVKQNGNSETKAVKNGGTLSLDYTVKSELTVGSVTLGLGETCDLYIDGELVVSDMKPTQATVTESVYAYSYGVIKSDKTFGFVYSKEGNYYSKSFVYTVELVSNNTIEQDILSYGDVTIENDSTYPYRYRSRVPSSRVAYVPSNRGVYDSVSTISFTVRESGVFAFEYYMDISEYTYVFISVGQELTFDDTTDYDQLIVDFGIGDEYGDYNKSEANHGTHGWRKKSIHVSAEDGNETVYIYFVKARPYDGFVDDTEDYFALSGVAHYVGNAVYTSSNRFASFGSFTATANGSSVDSGETLTVGSEMRLIATPSSDSVFYGWIINGVIASTEKDYSFTLVGDVTVEAVMQAANYYVVKDDSDFYVSLSEAVDASNKDRRLIFIADAIVTENVVVPSNVEILIPFAKDDVEGYAMGSTETASSRVSWANESKYLYLTLTVSDGVELVINGKFTLGGVQHYPDQSAQSHTSGAYSQIINDGVITLNDSAYLDVIGLIGGSGKINAKKGSTVRMPFIVNNFAGGTITLNSFNENSFPFYNYALINIQCDYEINYGAKVIGSESLFAMGAINTQDVTVVNSISNRVEGGDGALYWISENSSILFSYENKSVNVVMSSSYLADSGVTTLTIRGEVTLGEFYFESFGIGSNGMPLNLPYTLNFVIAESSTLVVPENRQYLIMPGCVMTVTPSGVLRVEGGLYVLDGLMQKPLAGKSYPSVDQLKNNGFAASGMLVDNGTIDITGTFAGVIQSAADGAIINVSDSAILEKSINLGTETSSGNNRIELTLTAKVGGLRYDKLTDLQCGNQYRSYILSDGANYVLSDFTLDSAVGYDDLTFAVNQEMQGYFGLVNGDKLEVERVLSIGEEKQGVLVEVDGTTRMTDENGEIVLQTYLYASYEYKTYNYDVNTRTVSDWNNLKPLVLSVPKSYGFDSESDYERVVAKNGTIEKEASVTGYILYYNGLSDKVELTLSGEYEDEYVQSVTFVSSDYVVVWTCSIYTQRASLTSFLDNIVSLSESDSDDLVENAKNVYSEYQILTKGLNTENLAYVDRKINEKVSYAQEYKNVLVSFEVSSSTYGDDTAEAIATTVDGRTVSVTVSCSNNYVFDSGVISADFVLSAKTDFSETISFEYIIIENYDGIDRRELVVVIEDKIATYGDLPLALTAICSGLASGDSQNEIIELVRVSGDNAGQYAITAQKSANAKSAFYSLKVTNGTYTINPKTVSVTLAALNVMLSKANSEAYVTAIYDGERIDLHYEILKEGAVVAKVKNGAVTVLSGDLSVGDYAVTAVSDDENYIITVSNECSYSVVENEDYYEFDLGISSEKVYDGKIVELIPSVRIAQTKEEADFTVKVNGSSSYQIKNAGVYIVIISADGYDYQTTFTITQKVLSVVWENLTKEYTGSVLYPDYVFVGVADGDVVSSSFEVRPVNAGDYDLTVVIDNDNYLVDDSSSCVFEIMPKSISLKVNELLDMRLSAIKTGEKAFFTVTQTDSDIKTNMLEYFVYSSEKVCVFKVNGQGVLEVLAEVTVGVYRVEVVCNDSNYSITSVPADLNVIEDNNYYTVEITFDAVSITEKVYDGQVVSVLVTASVTETGEKIDDSRIITSITKDGYDSSSILSVGLYTIKAVIDDETTYAFSYKVSRRTVELVWEETDFVYNGNSQIPNVTVANAIEGDDVSVALGDFECVESGVKTAFVSSLSGKDKDNYVLPEVTTFAYEIKVKSVSVIVTVLNAMVSRIENTLSIASTSDELDASQICFVIYNASEKKGELKNGVLSLTSPLSVGNYTVKAVSLNKNYEIVSQDAAFSVVEDEDYFDIDLGVSETTKVYDGEAVNFAVSVKNKQTQNGLPFEVSINDSDGVVRNAGIYRLTVKIYGVSFEYTYAIEKKIVTIVWSSDDFVYDGQSHLPVATIDGAISSDDVSVSVSAKNSISAGRKTVSAVSLNGKHAANYSLSGNLDFQYEIKPKTLTITVAHAEKVYGEIDGSIDISVAETIPSTDTLKSIVSVNREEGETVGRYKIIIECVNSNYELITTESFFVIKAKRVHVVIDNRKSTYGDAPISLSASCDSDVPQDAFSLIKEDGYFAGEYVIYGVSQNDNYEFVFENGVYTIEPRSIEITVPDVTVTYGDDGATLVAIVSDGFSLYYDDSIDDLVTLSRESGLAVGEYKISAERKVNGNYNVVGIAYTSPERSTYYIGKRSITIKANDKIVEDGTNYEKVVATIENDSYSIIEGNLVYGDELTVVPFVIYQNSQVVMTEDNFKDYFITGEHVVSLSSTHDYYDITIENGKLTVTKAKITVVNMQTEFVYADGEPIKVFDWQKNLSGNLKSANDKSFDVIITFNGETVDGVINAGEYKVSIVIRHTYAFEFASDAITDYVITVDKKDASDFLFAEGIPENGVGEYNPYASAIYGECGLQNVDIISIFYRNGEEIADETLSVGKYKLVITINNSNYKGEKSFEWEIVKKNVTAELKVTGVEKDRTYALGRIDSITTTLPNKYKNLSIIAKLVDSDGTVCETIEKTGVYKYVILGENDCYRIDQTIEFTVITNYDEIFDEIETLLSSFVDKETKAKNIVEIRRLLQKIDVSDREKITSVEEYRTVIEKTERAFSDFVSEIERTAQTAKRGVEQRAILELIDALSILAYFGIKQSL